MYKYLIALFFISATAHAQPGYPGKFSVAGDVAGIPGAEAVSISYPGPQGKIVNDSAKIINGKFQFNGIVTEPSFANLVLSIKGQVQRRGMVVDRNNKYRIYLEPAKYSLVAKDMFSKAIVKGSELQDEYLAYFTKVYALYMQLQPYNMRAQELERNIDFEGLARVQKKLDSLYDIEKQMVNNYVLAHPRSPVALFAVFEYYKPILSPKPLKQFYDNLDASLKQTAMGKQLAQQVEVEIAYGPGTPSADFTQPDTSGKPVRLSDFKGKYVFLDFWASWCGPCRAQNPFVKRAFELFKNKNFTIISLSIDDSKEKWLQAIAEDSVSNWTHVGDMTGRGNAAATLYHVTSVPKNLLIGPDGTVIAKNLHGLQLEETLKRFL